MMPEDPTDALLATLPHQDVTPSTSDAILRRALDELEASRSAESTGPTRSWYSVYFRFVEPTLLAGACAAHLYWAFSGVLRLIS